VTIESKVGTGGDKSETKTELKGDMPGMHYLGVDAVKMISKSALVRISEAGLWPRLNSLNPSDDRFARWIARLEARHLAELTFPEVSRALRALSSTYVERRQKLAEGAALSGAGKRAAFALFYGPIITCWSAHTCERCLTPTGAVSTVSTLAAALEPQDAAWASACKQSPHIVGIDRHPWHTRRGRRDVSRVRLTASTRQGDVATASLPKGSYRAPCGVTLNEMSELRATRVDAARRSRQQGDRVLIVEPIAGSSRDGGTLARRRRSSRGRADEWRVRADLPADCREARSPRPASITGRLRVDRCGCECVVARGPA